MCLAILLSSSLFFSTISQAENTPLQMACRNSNAQIVKALLAAGADVNIANEDYINVIPLQFLLHFITSYKLTFSLSYLCKGRRGFLCERRKRGGGRRRSGER